MSNYTIIKSFDFKERALVARQVVLKLKNYLPNLQVDGSHECGFNLPFDGKSNLTNMGISWLEKDYGPHLNSIIKYHDSRQLRFHSISYEKVDGLRFKDGIKYWSDDEVQLVLDTVNQVIQELNL